MSAQKDPHVYWMDVHVDRTRIETHAEFRLDDFDAQFFYGDLNTYRPEFGVKYLCGYVKMVCANSARPDSPRCQACVARLAWAKTEGDRLVSEFYARQVLYSEDRKNPRLTLEQIERRELARLLTKFNLRAVSASQPNQDTGQLGDLDQSQDPQARRSGS